MEDNFVLFFSFIAIYFEPIVATSTFYVEYEGHDEEGVQK